MDKSGESLFSPDKIPDRLGIVGLNALTSNTFAKGNLKRKTMNSRLGQSARCRESVGPTSRKPGVLPPPVVSESFAEPGMRRDKVERTATLELRSR